MIRLMPVILLVLVCAGALHADEKAEKLRELHEKFSSRVVVITWSSTTSGMGQTVETKGATTGLLVGNGGLVLISNQPLANNVGGMASMFGRGESTGPENFRIHTSDGKEYKATQALESADVNLRWFGAQLSEGAPAALALPAEVKVPALGEEVVIIGAHDATLNFARFFRTARINCIVEDGKYYGLDGSLADCLGGLVVTLSGEVLGIVGQKQGDEAPAGGGGFGRILGGLNDPSKALGNRVLMTPALFRDAHKKAQETVMKEGFHSGTIAPPAEKTSPEAQPLFEGKIAKVTWREKQKDLYVLIDVPEGQEAPEMGAKVEIHGADGKTVAVMEVTRRFNDPLVPNSRYDQIGGFLPDPDQKLKIQVGWRVIIPAEKPAETTPASRGWRGIERFTRMGADVLKDNYGGVKVGFTVSQIPAKDSATRAAGVKNGDVIYQVNDKVVTEEMSLQDFLKLLDEQSGEVTLYVVRRGGDKAEIKVAG